MAQPLVEKGVEVHLVQESVASSREAVGAASGREVLGIRPALKIGTGDWGLGKKYFQGRSIVYSPISSSPSSS
ncbi:MAG: hypothetical protein RMX65_017195 [Nostoc sp. DedQUE01]|nr:hypothetical protein [Nostoc sp. DedQUE11]MDZ8072487.1 hypothetical protein [Nostoc sp. DedQUE01]MDZ8078071.1 hypothetical protein [Nostoc sp. DcaGUA01]